MNRWCAHYPWLSREPTRPYGVRQVSPIPFDSEPITLAQAWAHLHIDTDGSPPASDEDYWLQYIGIPAARDWCEQWLGASIAPRILEYAAYSFPSDSFLLPFGPVLDIVSIKYNDTDGALQTMDPADYELDNFTRQNQVRLVYAGSWPSARSSPNAVKVRYTAGYSLAGDSPQVNVMPDGIRIGLLLMLGHLNSNRENSIGGSSMTIETIPDGAKSFLEGYRRRLSMA